MANFYPFRQPFRKPQTVLDLGATDAADWSPASNRGYREISTAVTYNGQPTFLHVPAENDVSDSILASMDYDLATIVDLDFENGYFTVPVYIAPEDYIRWYNGNLTVLFLISGAADFTNYVNASMPAVNLRPGWSYFFIPVDNTVLSSNQYASYFIDPIQGGSGLSSTVGRIRTRIDISVAGKITIGTSISSIDTGADTVEFTTAHELSDGDALFFTATTVPGGTTDHIPYFASVVDATTIQLYTEPALTNLVDLTSAGTSVTALYTPKVYFGPLTYGVKWQPQVCLTIDDSQTETYTEWYEGASLTAGENLKDLNWPATAFIIEETIDGAGMTSAQVDTLYAAGWHIGNHSTDSDVFDTITLEQVTTNVVSCRNAIIANGWGDGAILAYPAGKWTDLTDDLSNGILDAVKAAGVRFARTTHGGTASKGIVPMWPNQQAVSEDNLGLKILGLPCNADNAVADCLADIDHAISLGIPLVCIVLHRVVAGATGSNISPADADTLIAGLKARKAAGTINIAALDTALAELTGTAGSGTTSIISSNIS